MGVLFVFWTYLRKAEAKDPRAKRVKRTAVLEVRTTVRDFVQLLMILGTGNPKATGVRALWKGLRDFDLIYQAFCMMINWT